MSPSIQVWINKSPSPKYIFPSPISPRNSSRRQSHDNGIWISDVNSDFFCLYRKAYIRVNMTKPSSVYNVLAMVNTILSKNIKVHTDNKGPNTK